MRGARRVRGTEAARSTGGTEVVALGGTLCAPVIFEPLKRCLEGRARVDVFDWLATSGSFDLPSVTKRLAATLESREHPVLLLGHSTGGAICLQLALSRPELVSALIVTNSGANMRNHPDVDRIIDAARQQWGPDLVAAVVDRSFSEPPTGAFRRTLLDYGCGVPQAAVLEVLDSQRALDLVDLLPEISCPTTVVHGTFDRARTRADAQALADGIPDSVLLELPTGHTSVHELPEEVADVVVAMIGRVNQRSVS